MTTSTKFAIPTPLTSALSLATISVSHSCRPRRNNLDETAEGPIAGDCNPKAICGTARRVPNGGCTDEKADYSGIGATHHCRGADPSTLAAVIAQHSPAVRAFEKRVIVRLFRGSTSFGARRCAFR